MNKKFIGIIAVIICVFLMCSCSSKKAATTLYENGENIDVVSVDETSAAATDIESVVSVKVSSENAKSNVSSDSESEEEWVDSNAPQNKEEVINGETIVFKYNISKKASDNQVHDCDEYVAENGAIARYDRVTGQFFYYYKSDISGEKNDVTEVEINRMAEEFIKKYCDISKYTYIETKFNEYTGYTVWYSKIINNLESSEGINISFSFDGKINWFNYNPYVFDDISVNLFDVNDVILKLENDIKNRYGDNYTGYKIISKRICLDENGKPAIAFTVEENFKSTGEEMTSGNAYMYTL